MWIANGAGRLFIGGVKGPGATCKGNAAGQTARRREICIVRRGRGARKRSLGRSVGRRKRTMWIGGLNNEAES